MNPLRKSRGCPELPRDLPDDCRSGGLTEADWDDAGLDGSPWDEESGVRAPGKDER